MTTEITYPTHLEAKNSLDSCLSHFADSKTLNESELKSAFIGIANSIQIRDYSMGAIPLMINDYQDITRFMNLLHVIGGDSAHFQAVWSAFAYESGNSEEAFKHLEKCYELDSENSLGRLLGRVFRANWPHASFTAMRTELHPKVIEALADLEGVAVNEE
jgi:hypothetical protein